MKREQVIKDLLGIFRGDIDWEFQCPPERAGAMIALLHVLGAGWERAKGISLHCVTENELITAIGTLNKKHEK